MLPTVSVPTVTLGSFFNVGFAKSAQPLAPGPGCPQRWVNSPKFGGAASAQQALCGMLGGGHGMVLVLGGASLH
jgi:hypothetical protein